ncbi:MAG: hypothetical protein JSR53_11960 [Proteobacteria bacterium]|nr:hypothetical protein [Pseudomonadota bacterium]
MSQFTRKERALLLFAGLLLGACSAWAGSKAYTLDWAHPGEELSYRTCGCADACWVAEVQEKASHILRARLRCDCETLYYYQPSREPQRTVLGSCDAINNGDDKFDAIGRRLQELLHRRAQ